jgi:hypothetical protein
LITTGNTRLSTKNNGSRPKLVEFLLSQRDTIHRIFRPLDR